MRVRVPREFAVRASADEKIGAKNSPVTAKKAVSPRILVVDDEPLVCWSVAETLGDCGYEVIKAPDARSAMQAFSKADGKVDIVLLDVSLPDADGFDVLTAIRQRSPATPIILMTVYGSPELRDDARRLGAFAVVDKPFEMSDLAPLVERALHGRPS